MKPLPTRILVTGASGLLGGRLARLLATESSVVAAKHEAPAPHGLPEVSLDLTRAASVEDALERTLPDVVLHCAAMGDVDRCEREPQAAENVNARGAETLARRCRLRGIRLIALSTDLVFAGTGGLLKETDPALPTLVYARTKLEGEEAILAETPDSLVLRVSLIQGRGHGPRPTASEAVAWSLCSGRRVRLFTDQYRTPVDPESVAAAVALLVRGSGRGRYHIGGPERISRHELGLRVAKAFGLPGDWIEAVTQAEYRPGVPRPPDTSLDSSRALRELGWRPRPLEQGLRESRLGPD